MSKKRKNEDVVDQVIKKRRLLSFNEQKEQTNKRIQELKEKRDVLLKKYQLLVKDKTAKIEDLKKEKEKLLCVEGTKIQIRPLDIYRINTKKEGQRVGIFGMTGSGKSIVALAIMAANSHIPYWQIHSSSESRNHQYGRHLPNELTIFDDLDVKGLENCKLRQLKKCKEWEIPNTDPTEYKYDISIGIIIDDVAEDESVIRKEPIFKYIHCVSRHDGVLFIELYQYYSQLIPKFRRQLSWVFIMRPVSEKDVKTMHNEFFSMFTYSNFKQLIQIATKNHGCLVLDVLNQEPEIGSRVFYYKAPYPVPGFKIGTRYSRKMYGHLYDPQWEDTRKNERNEKEIELAQLSEQQRELNELENQVKQQEKVLKEFEREKKVIDRLKSKKQSINFISLNDGPDTSIYSSEDNLE